MAWPPSAAVVERLEAPVRWFVARTATPDTAPPPAPRTTPLIRPVWASAGTAYRAAASAATVTNRLPRLTIQASSSSALVVSACPACGTAMLRASLGARKEGKRRRSCWKNSGGRRGLGLRAPLRRVAERPHCGEQHRDDDAGQADLVAPHLERHGGDEQQHRQQGEARERPQPDRHAERAAQPRPPAAEPRQRPRP